MRQPPEATFPDFPKTERLSRRQRSFGKAIPANTLFGLREFARQPQPLRPKPCYRAGMPDSDEFDGAALDFARLCLLQPESHLTDAWRQVAVRPDGYNTGPEAFADNRSLQCDDIGEVLPIVAYWCRLNTVTLEIHYFDEVYSYRFTQGLPAYHIVETDGSANLCHELLFGASFLAEQMKTVNPPNTTVKWSAFTGEA
jgi:hypothetical protein